VLVLPFKATDNELRAAVRAWLQLMAEERYGDAQQLLMQEKVDRHWSMEEIVSRIEELTGGKISFPSEAAVKKEFDDVEFSFINDPVELVVRYFHLPGVSPDVPTDAVAHITTDLPIDGTWSDTWVSFHVRSIAEGLALELLDVQRDKVDES
jgi:hypothetical protein